MYYFGPFVWLKGFTWQGLHEKLILEETSLVSSIVEIGCRACKMYNGQCSHVFPVPLSTRTELIVEASNQSCHSQFGRVESHFVLIHLYSVSNICQVFGE